MVFNIHNYKYGMAIELIRIDTWPVKMVSGHKQPAQLNQDTAAEYELWLQFKFYTNASGRKEEEEKRKITKGYVLTESTLILIIFKQNLLCDFCMYLICQILLHHKIQLQESV